MNWLKSLLFKFSAKYRKKRLEGCVPTSMLLDAIAPAELEPPKIRRPNRRERRAYFAAKRKGKI